MASSSKLYIDPDGIRRGYYVYVHKDCSTGEVFYVGKGYGRRAWSTKSRNSRWESKVASLSNGWQAEIVQDNLSEDEAFNLEVSLIDKYGGPEAIGGKLTNESLGGESSLEISVGFEFDDGGWSQAYFDARVFKQFSREEEEVLVQQYNESLASICNEIDKFKDEGFDQEDKRVADLAVDMDFFAGSLLDFNRDFLRRRLSWKELGISVEEMIEDIEFDLEEEKKYPENMRSVLERVLSLAREFLTKIDSGNMTEAQQIANRKTGRT